MFHFGHLKFLSATAFNLDEAKILSQVKVKFNPLFGLNVSLAPSVIDRKKKIVDHFDFTPYHSIKS